MHPEWKRQRSCSAADVSALRLYRRNKGRERLLLFTAPPSSFEICATAALFRRCRANFSFGGSSCFAGLVLYDYSCLRARTTQFSAIYRPDVNSNIFSIVFGKYLLRTMSFPSSLSWFPSILVHIRALSLCTKYVLTWIGLLKTTIYGSIYLLNLLYMVIIS